MKTISVKITEEQYSRLEAEAKARGISRSALVRQMIEGAPIEKENTLYDLMKPYLGSGSGPKDLSTNKTYMKGYGQSRSD